MAWTTSGLYVDTIQQALGSAALALNLDSATDQKVALYTNSLTPNFSVTDPQYSSTNEVTGTGYAAGGVVLGSSSIAVSSGYLVFSGANVSWPSSTLTGVRGGIVYADALTNNNLVCGINFGADYQTADGTLLITWHANGIFRINSVP